MTPADDHVDNIPFVDSPGQSPESGNSAGEIRNHIIADLSSRIRTRSGGIGMHLLPLQYYGEGKNVQIFVIKDAQ